MFRCSYKDGRNFKFANGVVNSIVLANAEIVSVWCWGRKLNEIKIERLCNITLPEGCCDINEIKKFLEKEVDLVDNLTCSRYVQ